MKEKKFWLQKGKFDFCSLLAGKIIILPLTQVVIMMFYPQEKQDNAMRILGLAVGIVLSIASTLMGIVIDSWSW